VPNPRGFAPRPGAHPAKPKPKLTAGTVSTGVFSPGQVVATTFPGQRPASTGGKPGVDVGTVNVSSLQKQLASAGYHIPADEAGKLGPMTKAALADYLQPSAQHPIGTALRTALAGTVITGKRDPTTFNLRFDKNDKTPSPYKKVNVDSATGNIVTDPGANGTVDLGTPGLSPATQSLISEALAKVGKNIPTSLAQFGAQIDPATADAIAGEQFDPQIREAQLALARDPLQALQDTKDIKSWYGQAIDALNTAAGRDSAASKAGVNSIGDAASAIVASLGGSANPGAAEAGAAGDNAANTLAAMGTAQDQYNADLAPLLENEKASQMVNQSNKDRAQEQADRVALENLQGQRGQAKTAAADQIRSENNSLAQARAQMLAGILGDNNSLAQQRLSNVLGIKQANNAAAQTNFSNALSLAQAQIAAMMSGLQVQTAQAKLGKTINPNSFAYASPTVKNSAYQQAAANLFDPNTNQPLNLTPQQAQLRVNSVLAGFGWNPAPGTPAGQFGANIVNAWLAANGGQ
jgi:hypothetical protein